MSELQEKYETVYKEGDDKFWTFLPLDERRAVFSSLPMWTDFDVLEIGCGAGHMAGTIAAAGVKQVIAIDTSFNAIKQAMANYTHEKITFLKADYTNFRQENKSMDLPIDYDVVIAIGVLEHLEQPFKRLQFIMQHIVKPGGIALITCPNFVNPRGYVWMALQELAGWKMSLTDKEFIHPEDMTVFCNERGYDLNIVSLDEDWGSGPRTIIDFTKRLKLAGPPEIDETIEKFLTWLEKSLRFEQANNMRSFGANLLYQIARKPD